MKLPTPHRVLVHDEYPWHYPTGESDMSLQIYRCSRGRPVERLFILICDTEDGLLRGRTCNLVVASASRQ